MMLNSSVGDHVCLLMYVLESSVNNVLFLTHTCVSVSEQV